MSIDLKKIMSVNIIYNKYHSPETITKILSINQTSFDVEFTGSFCISCGFYDYFDDYKILLQEHGIDATILKIIEIEEGAIVKFKTHQ
jgi:superoxide reductase